MPFAAGEAGEERTGYAVPPQAQLMRLWERITRSADPMVVTGIAVAVAVVAVIVAVVVASSGGGGGSHLPAVPVASTASLETAPSQSTSTEEATPTETTATTPTVEQSQVEQVLNEYQQDYSNENIEGLKSLFAEGLERQDGTRPSEDLAAAVATYEHQFSELTSPSYSLSQLSVQPGTGEATAKARYSISSQNGTVKGSITYHLIEQDQRLLIDRLTIVPDKR
jgi:hypothetical protein